MPDKTVVDAVGLHTMMLLTQTKMGILKDNFDSIERIVSKQVDIMVTFAENLKRLADKVDGVPGIETSLKHASERMKKPVNNINHLKVVKFEGKDIKTLDKTL